MTSRKILTLYFVTVLTVLSVSYSDTSSFADDKSSCINHGKLVELVQTEAINKKRDEPRFRIKRADDGQSLVYWHFGEKTGSFYAATFRTDGCAILTDNGAIRRFAFPKTAFNTGVFFELDVLKLSY